MARQRRSRGLPWRTLTSRELVEQSDWPQLLLHARYDWLTDPTNPSAGSVDRSASTLEVRDVAGALVATPPNDVLEAA